MEGTCWATEVKEGPGDKTSGPLIQCKSNKGKLWKGGVV